MVRGNLIDSRMLVGTADLDVRISGVSFANAKFAGKSKAADKAQRQKCLRIRPVCDFDRRMSSIRLVCETEYTAEVS
jgi:hypothetical protein